MIDGEDHSARRHACPCGHDHVLDVGDLIDRSAADLAHRFGDPVHSVQVTLAKLPSVGVDGQCAAHLDVAIADEVLGLTPAAPTELLDGEEHEGREGVIEDSRLDVARPKAGVLVELAGDQSHFGDAPCRRGSTTSSCPARHPNPEQPTR